MFNELFRASVECGKTLVSVKVCFSVHRVSGRKYSDLSHEMADRPHKMKSQYR